jgi:hypothetical protein
MHFPSTKGIAARAATAALGFALVLSQVPAAALAEAAGTAGAQATAQQTSAEAAPDAATTQGEPAAAPASEGEAPSAAGSTSATPAAPDAATASAVASVAATTAATPAAPDATSSVKAAPAVATVAPEVARIVSASGSQVRYYTVVAPGAKLTVNAYTTEDDDWGDADEAPVDTSAYAGYAFQWYRGTVVSYGTKFDSYTPIAGATSRSYTVVDADADSYLACKISFTRADGSHGELWSDNSTGKVTDGRATLDSAKVTGTAKEGQTLLASAYVANGWGGTTEADSSSFVAWQWQQASASDGTYVDIAGATKVHAHPHGRARRQVPARACLVAQQRHIRRSRARHRARHAAGRGAPCPGGQGTRVRRLQRIRTVARLRHGRQRERHGPRPPRLAGREVRGRPG